MPRQSVSLLVFNKGLTGTLPRASRLSHVALSIAGTTISAGALHGTPLSVSIFNLGGKLLRHFSTMQSAIDVHKGLPRGVYIVQANAGAERLTGKMVVRDRME